MLQMSWRAGTAMDGVWWVVDNNVPGIGDLVDGVWWNMIQIEGEGAGY